MASSAALCFQRYPETSLLQDSRIQLGVLGELGAASALCSPGTSILQGDLIQSGLKLYAKQPSAFSVAQKHQFCKTV